MSLAAFGLVAVLGAWYWAAVGLAAALLVWEHRLVRADDLGRLDAAFFTMNGIISAVVLAGTALDVLL